MTPLNKSANKRYLLGDPITNGEVRELLNHYTELAEHLEQHGNIYRLVTRDARLHQQRLQSYFASRVMKRDDIPF